LYLAHSKLRRGVGPELRTGRFLHLEGRSRIFVAAQPYCGRNHS
jgi:hypothetical protein